MCKKPTLVANSHKKTDQIKEKQRKADRKQLDLHEDCENFVNFCKKKSLNCINGETQSFKEFMSSSN